MKSLLISAVIICLTAALFGQSRTTREPTDTIFRIDTKILPVNVTTVTPAYVSFTYPGKSEIYTIERKDVHKIIYKNGRVEELNKPAVIEISQESWEAVWLTEEKKDVANMYKLGEVESTSPPSARSPKAAKKGAIIKLQKKAANLKGSIILVTYKEKTGGYGEYPGYIIRGVVYGYEPPEEDTEIK
ncbi:MAG: hypothetical protein JXB00_20015 [Bacteroidales bacterium]|nr:hypothetical protein [Bacteroidales bacterium]